MPDAKWYANWVRMMPAKSTSEKMRNLEAADLIESLSAELEQVKREREAAIEELRRTLDCSICKHNESSGGDCDGWGRCGFSKPKWQWHGVTKEE